MTTIAVVGSLNTDHTLHVERLPHPGDTVVAHGMSTVGFGGKGANQAAAVAALGATVSMIGRVGDDEEGNGIRGDLLGRGVNVTDIITTPGTRSGVATIAVEDVTGDNLILVDPGANSLLSPADVLVQSVTDADIVLLQLEIPLATAAAAARTAQGLVILNPAPPVPLPAEFLECVDVLVPNLTELAILVSANAPSELVEIAALAGKLSATADVIVTLGARGALVRTSQGQVTHVTAPHVDVVDTSGAGDCFCGSLAVALAEGRTLIDATAFAVAASAFSTTSAGARARLPKRSDTESLLRLVTRHPVVDKSLQENR